MWQCHEDTWQLDFFQDLSFLKKKSIANNAVPQIVWYWSIPTFFLSVIAHTLGFNIPRFPSIYLSSHTQGPSIAARSGVLEPAQLVPTALR